MRALNTTTADNTILYDPSRLNNLYGYFEEISSPTSVDHAIYCNIISQTQKHLVLVRSHILEVYSFIETKNENQDVKDRKKFNFLFAETLADNLFDICSVRFIGHNLDSLIMSFRDAKVAIVEIDPINFELKTISLHNYEFENLKTGQFIIKNGPILRIDPQQRCAVALVYDSQIAVLPFRRPETLDFDTHLQNVDNLDLKNGPICSTYTINLSRLFNDPITDIKDMKFLHGFYQPTLLILYEPTGTWVGHISSRKDTCCVVALSFNLQRRTNPVIWFVENLPYDCLMIQPVLQPQYGALIIAVNSIIYIKQTHPSIGMPLNCYARNSSNFLMKLPIPSCGPLTMDGVKILPLNSTDYLMGLGNGNFYILTLWIDELTNYLISFIINHVNQCITPQCFILIEDSHIFIGSRNTSSLLCTFDTSTLLVNMKGEIYSENHAIESDVPPNENPEQTNGVCSESETNDEIIEEKLEEKIEEKLEEKLEEKPEEKIEEKIEAKITFNEEDTMLYGREILEKPINYKTINLYNIKKLDSLFHFGPISTLSVGEVNELTQGLTDTSDEYFNLAQSEYSNTELLATIFPRKFVEDENTFTGILSLQNTVKSKAMVTFEIPQHTHIWSLLSFKSPMENSNEFGENDPEEGTKSFSKRKHTHLLLSSHDSTMILEVDKEIVELEISGFGTAEQTVSAFNLIKPNTIEDELYFVQICPTSLRLLENSMLIEHLQLTREWPINLVSHSDPYALICSEDDELFLLRLREDPLNVDEAHGEGKLDPENLDHQLKNSKYFHVEKPSVHQVSPVLAIAIYHDKAGNLTKIFKANFISQQLNGRRNHENSLNKSQDIHDDDEKTKTEKSKNQRRLEEEEIFIYGSSLISQKPEEEDDRLPLKRIKSSKNGKDNQKEEDEGREGSGETNVDQGEFLTNYFAFIAFTNGTLEVYSLPSFRLVYQVQHLNLLPSFLIEASATHYNQLSASIMKSTSVTTEEANQEDLCSPIQEIILSPVGLNQDRHILYVRTNHEIVMYEAVINFLGNEEELIWRRLPIPCLLAPPKRISQETQQFINQSKYMSRNNLMTRFEDLTGEHSGVFIAGLVPVWIFSSDIGLPRVHFNSVTGVVSSFAQLNCDMSPNGFIILTQTNEMRLSSLLPRYDYHNEVGVKKIPFEEVPQFIQFHVESKVYAVISYIPLETKSIFKLNSEGAKEEEVYDRPSTCVFPTKDQYYLRLYSSELATSDSENAWDLVPNSTIEFEPWEVVSCFTTVRLRDEKNATESTDFLAIGANLVYGEEIPVRGRILLLDIVSVVPEIDQPLTAHKLKCFHDNEEKGPITALASCNGLLISAIGQKVFIWSLSDSNLTGVAFVDTDLYIHTMLNIRGIIIAADIMKSVHLLRFQNDFRVLSLLAKESVTREVYTLNFFVDNMKLGILSTDEYGNLIISNYDPLNKNSCNGRRLIRRADFRMPSRAISCLRVCNSTSHPLLTTMKIIQNSQTIVDDLQKKDDLSSIGISKRTKPDEKGMDKPQTVAHLVKSLNTGSFAMDFINSKNDEEKETLKHTVYFANQNGSFSKISSIKEKVHNRLRIVERNLAQFVGPKAGLQTKYTRQYKRPFPEMENIAGNIINGDSLRTFFMLSHTQRVEIAKKSGQTWKAIYDDISEVIAATMHF